jgi:CO/xanthine dehydrogenase Mo-binding subunit
MVQGLGYALLENVVYRDGVMQNAQLTNYIIPTFLDMPPVDVVLTEKGYSRGPAGAKGVGELPMDVPAPAIAAAVYNATGLLLTDLPILPERLLEAHLARVHSDSAAGALAPVARSREAAVSGGQR